MEAISDSVARVIDAVRTNNASAEVLDQVQAKLDAVLELLRGHRREGPHSQAYHRPPGAAYASGKLFDPQQIMPYSPIIGRLNPVSPRLEFHVVGSRLEGGGSFPVRFVGAPQTVHGGMVAAALDEIMGVVNFLNNEGAFTGTLAVRYHKPTPIERDLTFSAEMVAAEGRKITSRAEIRCDGELTASAEGLFIRPRTSAVMGKKI